MSELTPEIAADILAAAQAGAEEAAGALSRALGRELAMEVGEATAFDPANPPETLDGAGLAIVMTFAGVGAVAVLPESTGLTPDWAPAPDPTGESKLATLAQELSMLLVPETLMADDFQAGWVGDTRGALARGGLAAGAGAIPLTLTSGDAAGVMWLLWPLPSPGAVLSGGAKTAAPEAPAEPSARVHAAISSPYSRQRIFDFSQLPPLSRSQLKVRVPLVVILAEKRQSVDEVMALCPGSILMFDKQCDAPVEVYVREHPIALGETVKVGERFGVKLSQMILPAESFKPLRPKNAG